MRVLQPDTDLGVRLVALSPRWPSPPTRSSRCSCSSARCARRGVALLVLVVALAGARAPRAGGSRRSTRVRPRPRPRRTERFVVMSANVEGLAGAGARDAGRRRPRERRVDVAGPAGGHARARWQAWTTLGLADRASPTAWATTATASSGPCCSRAAARAPDPSVARPRQGSLVVDVTLGDLEGPHPGRAPGPAAQRPRPVAPRPRGRARRRGGGTRDLSSATSTRPSTTSLSQTLLDAGLRRRRRASPTVAGSRRGRPTAGWLPAAVRRPCRSTTSSSASA